MIDIYYKDDTDLVEDVKWTLREKFNIGEIQIDVIEREELFDFLKTISKDVFYIFETNYVDKLYRDSFYSFFSTKQILLPRNCVRISFFSEKIDEETYYDKAGRKKMRDSYLGYLVVTPNAPYILGRSSLNPQVFNKSGIQICTCTTLASINGVQLGSQNFPFTFVDKQTVNCAEICVWSIMEYFSSRYPEYQPALPSKMYKILDHLREERILPSIGLDITEVSFLLKHLGFGPVLYDREIFPDDFNRLIMTYMDSGLPLIGMISESSRHAVVCCGRETTSHIPYSKWSLKDLKTEELVEQAHKKNLKFYDHAEISKNVIIMDSSKMPYSLVDLDDLYSSSDNNKPDKFDFILAPLYPKIYLDASRARNYMYNVLVNYIDKYEKNDIYVKIFMTSSRSYKKYVVESELHPGTKEAFLKQEFPKFVWVAEIGYNHLKVNQIAGVVILNATEPNDIGTIPLHSILINGSLREFEEIDGMSQVSTVPLRPFSRFVNNQNTY